MAQGYFEMQTGAAFQLADYLLYLLSHIHPCARCKVFADMQQKSVVTAVLIACIAWNNQLDMQKGLPLAHPI